MRRCVASTSKNSKGTQWARTYFNNTDKRIEKRENFTTMNNTHNNNERVQFVSILLYSFFFFFTQRGSIKFSRSFDLNHSIKSINIDTFGDIYIILLYIRLYYFRSAVHYSFLNVKKWCRVLTSVACYWQNCTSDDLMPGHTICACKWFLNKLRCHRLVLRNAALDGVAKIRRYGRDGD